MYVPALRYSLTVRDFLSSSSCCVLRHRAQKTVRAARGKRETGQVDVKFGQVVLVVLKVVKFGQELVKFGQLLMSDLRRVIGDR